MIYRVQIGKTSRKGMFVADLDKVIQTDNLNEFQVRDWFQNKYDGYTIQVSICNQIETVDIPNTSKKICPDQYTEHTYFRNTFTVKTPEIIKEYADAYIKLYNLKQILLKKTKEYILEKNPHLKEIRIDNIDSVYSESVVFDVVAWLKDKFIVENRPVLLGDE